MPVSVSALSAKDLTDRSVSSIASIGTFTPNVQFDTVGNSGGTSSQAVLFIRGVGQADFTPTADPGVGIYLDGVYLGRTAGAVLASKDLNQIEVLRGPQGTLFGRNTVGGAVVLTSKQPTKDPHGEAEITYGSDTLVDAYGRLSGPLIANKLLGGLSVDYRFRDGYQRAVNVPGRFYGNEDKFSSRLQLALLATDKLKFDLSGDYYRQRQNSVASAFIDQYSNATTTRTQSLNAGLTNLYNSFSGPLGGVPLTLNDITTDPFVTGKTGLSRDNYDVWGVNFTINYAINDIFSVKSISAYRGIHADFGDDQDGTPANVAETNDVQDQRQFSQEFQFNAKTARINFVGGLFYFNEKTKDLNNVNLIPGLYNFLQALPAPVLPFNCDGASASAGGPPISIGGNNNPANISCDFELGVFSQTKINQFAIFGQTDYAVTDQLKIILGGRYTYEQKDFVAYQQKRAASANYGIGVYSFDAGGGNYSRTVNGATTYFTPTPSTGFATNGRSWQPFTWLAGFSYQLDPDKLGYFTYSRGFKSGTFNGRVSNALTNNAVDPETVSSYEVGFKTSFFERRLRFNIAGFYADYAGIQLTANPPGIGSLIFLINGGKARITGFEIETVAKPVQPVTLGINYGFEDSKITAIADSTTLDTGIRVGNILPRTPRNTLTIYGQYDMPLFAAAHFSAHLDYSYKSAYYFDAVNNAQTLQPGYGLLNGRLALGSLDDRYQLSLYATNLTGKVYYNNLFRSSGDQIIGNPARKREGGVTLRVKF